jgi:hypothetical protein
MMLREFYGKHDLIETANEATIGSRNELGHTLAAFKWTSPDSVQCDDGYFKYVLQ